MYIAMNTARTVLQNSHEHEAKSLEKEMNRLKTSLSTSSMKASDLVGEKNDLEKQVHVFPCI